MNFRDWVVGKVDAQIAEAEDVTVRSTLDVTTAEIKGYVTGLFGTADQPVVDAQSVTLTSGADPAAEVHVHDEPLVAFVGVHVTDTGDGSTLDIHAFPDQRSDGTYWVAHWGHGMADPGDDIEAELTIVKAL